MPFVSFSVLQTILIAGFALSLAGCEVGADYQKPDMPTPAAWTQADTDHAVAKAEIDQQWWKNFNDPLLTRLITQAAADNFDLKIAQARIAQARAGVASSQAALLPTGDVKGTATREANQLALPGGSDNPTSALLHKPFNIFQTGFDASWELDLFGGNRRAEEAAQAQLQASEASRDDVRVSLLAEVARTYIVIRHAQAQINLVDQRIKTNERTLAITQQLFNAGQSARLDVTQAEAKLEQAQSAAPTARNTLAQAFFTMDVLLGQQPGATRALITEAKPIPEASGKIVLAAPASVIAQRPDIRVAERHLAAATAQQGSALAKFFPDISLTGFFGALNTSTNNLISAPNQSWMAGGSVIWPILSYGTLAANLDAADARQQENMAVYQKTVIAALSDVERSLSAFTEQEKFLQSAQNEVDKDKRAHATAQERYQQGLTSRLEVLEAERVLLTAQEGLLQARADAQQNLIALYKSLGGGWVKS